MADMRNFVNLIGYLGRDAELRDYEVRNPDTGAMDKRQCVELSLCTNTLSRPVFHDVVGYDDHHTAYLGPMKKGEKLMVTGYLYYDESEKKGVKRIHPKVVIQTFERMMLPKEERVQSTRQKALAS